MAKSPPVDELATNRELRTTAQAMAQLNCSRSTIDRLAKQGRLERVPFGGHTRITARSLNALVDQVLTGDTLYPKERQDHE